MAGTEIYTHNLSRELSKDNQVFVFYRVCDLKKREYELSEATSGGLNIFTVNNTFRFCDSFEKFYRNDAISETFAKVLDRIKPDIVHIQHLIFLSTTIINEIKKRQIPIIFTLHDYWLICPQWHSLKRNLEVCDNKDVSQCIDCLDYQLNIKKLSKNIYLISRRILPGFGIRFLRNTYLKLVKPSLNYEEALETIKSRRKHIKELCNLVDLFIAPSQFLMNEFVRFGIPKEKIKFVPYGIETELSSGYKKEPSDKIRFSFIGTILPAKGLDVLIKAFNKVKDKHVELNIYGNLFPYKGFEYYPGFIKKLVKNVNIRFMGGFNHKDFPAIFAQIDVLVFPSVWNENLPLVILEAFSTKTPVIASKIGGIPEIVKENVNGFLFNSGDAGKLNEKIEFIINNPEVIKKFQSNTPKVKSIKENAQEMEEIYADLIAKMRN